MKLTNERLSQLIKEVIEEHRGVAAGELGIKGQQLASNRADENSENTRKRKEEKDRAEPGAARELRSLSRGLTEDEYEDDGEWIRIKKSSLDRLIKEGTRDSAIQHCNKLGMKTLKQWLLLTNAFADAGKGKFGEIK
jgi:hypothetical protein